MPFLWISKLIKEKYLLSPHFSVFLITIKSNKNIVKRYNTENSPFIHLF